MKYTRVRRAVSAVMIDSYDEDRNPELVKVNGTVTFTPLLKDGDVVQWAGPNGPQSLVLAPIECFISNGIIMHRGGEGIFLAAGGPGVQPDVIQWKATFKNMQAGGWAFNLKPVMFDAVPDGEVDLTLVSPIAGASEPIVRGPAGVGLKSITVDGSELVVTVTSEAGTYVLSRIPLEDVVRAEADQAVASAQAAIKADVDAAAGSASAAKSSEDAAAKSATDAQNAASQTVATAQAAIKADVDAAAASASAAQASAATATTQAETATTQAKAASTSAANAKTSETNAKTSETTAGESAATATSEADRAKTEADRAATSAQAAKAAQQAAEGHANRSATSESNAKTSETNAKQSETNAGDYAAVATTAATEAVDAMERATDLAGGDFATHEYVDQKVSSVALTGTGSPEGKISAPIGSVYTDSAATTGAIRWIKTSGTGTTGWKVEYGDTGWRDLSSLLPSGMTGAIHFRRQNDWVYLIFGNITGLTANLTLSIPDTAPRNAHYMEVAIANTRTTERQLFRVIGNNHVLMPNGTNPTANGSVSWLTQSSWPTSLPGTPA